MKPRLFLAHAVGVVVSLSLLFAVLEFLDFRFLQPSGFGWFLMYVIGFGVYFYIVTTMIRLEPLGAGEKIRTDHVTESRESRAAMVRLEKYYERLEEEQSRDWNCSRWREPNGEAFEYCWNCNAERGQES